MKDGEVVTVYEDHPSEGRKKVWGEYDRPEITKPVDRPPTDALPAYRVLFSAQKLGGGKFGDVLVLSLSRTTPASERGAIARRIAQQEGLTEISIYSSKEAYKANVSASYLKQHPDALKKGFLGSIRDGQFTPGGSVFPKDSEKGQTERKATRTSAITLLRMGQALERQERLKPALEYYQRLVKEYPNAPEANTARMRIEELTKP
ncbi:MAG: tetratricopeptide repeat protein [Planctomycetaceae bacterium]|nr:tetratricopeptide repeat protein [Planctomycetaceae bacterium]